MVLTVQAAGLAYTWLGGPPMGHAFSMAALPAPALPFADHRVTDAENLGGLGATHSFVDRRQSAAAKRGLGRFGKGACIVGSHA